MTGILPSTSGVYHNCQPWHPALPDAKTQPKKRKRGHTTNSKQKGWASHSDW